MASHPTGSDELVYIQTNKVSVTIKGPASHPRFEGGSCTERDSALRVFCREGFSCNVKGTPEADGFLAGHTYSGTYRVAPLFFEQQRYEILIEATDGHTVHFWHDNLNLRQKVTSASRRHPMLSGIINFGNEIGASDFVIQIDGRNYLRIELEVFPTKIDYKSDYRAIVEDITREIYSLVFDFLKKTYLAYQQKDQVSGSPVEFFAILRRIYGDFLRAADRILAQPHHALETSHDVVPGHKAHRLDQRSLRWLEKHAGLLADRVLTARKQVTYDTRENRLTKYILLSVAKKLLTFKRNYCRLQRDADAAIVTEIEGMIQNINRRSMTSFMSEIQGAAPANRMSLVFSMAPGYRELYKYYLILLRGLDITGDIFHVSPKDLALLYEYWCFIKLNSLMKEKYQMVSQDIIRVRGNGLYVSLVKGQGSRVKYHNPATGEGIVLSYNPKEMNLPTGAQRPDNVLSLKKRGAKVDYEYVFDAKYRLNPALPGTEYQKLYKKPGPEVDDINTMHRYRDAIVYDTDASFYERTMFGAYVLFPYGDEDKYESHKFYQSIGKVNIGGLPFLPSATKLVSRMLDDLIADSPESAFERTTLPRGIEEKLAKVDWSVRDVLVGSMSRSEQLAVCLWNRFYHIPEKRLKRTSFPIRYIALYQSKNLFGEQAGIRYYGEVVSWTCVPRKEIRELPSGKEDLYYRFEVREWKTLSKAIAPKEVGLVCFFTNLFLLEHSALVPELKLKSEEEFRLYSELKRALNSTEINDSDTDIRFQYKDAVLVFENGKINIYKDGKIKEPVSVEQFARRPGAEFRKIFAAL